MSIDLTGSPSPSPKVKVERELVAIKQETAAGDRGKRNIKQEATGDDSSRIAGTRLLARAEVGTHDNALTSTEKHEKKRKAVQDELKEVELEEQRVALAQKRLRLQKTLAEMKETGN